MTWLWVATRPTLVRQAEHFKYDLRNIGKKSLNVKSGHTHEALADHYPVNRTSQQSQICYLPQYSIPQFNIED